MSRSCSRIARVAAQLLEFLLVLDSQALAASRDDLKVLLQVRS